MSEPTTYTPKKLGPGTLTFTIGSAATDFAAKCKSVELNPDLPDDDGTGMLDGSIVFDDTVTFGTIGGTIYQEYTLEALEVWAALHAGKIADYVFKPTGKSGYAAKGKCKIKPMKLGGDPKKANTTDFSFPLVGALPTFSAGA